ncbi:hypothetical protein SAMN04515674_104327 [Pseudarcicella hirudinis]|uniref:Uncharacterized protein n=1 Tax=Pseudarcicella hirudinis TaxID=1079859 RepID=A0A1I5RZE9_9BACT|nr:hypothetical protein SAMN04515674_104327 [Pseudarcicella hirudinis]
MLGIHFKIILFIFKKKHYKVQITCSENLTEKIMKKMLYLKTPLKFINTSFNVRYFDLI